MGLPVVLSVVLAAGIMHLETGMVADFDGSGRVDFLDFVAFAQAFGSGQAKYDLDGSGTVDFGDFVSFARAFGQTSGSQEPDDAPRLRKYGVEHPVFPIDHPIWDLERTQVQADDWVDRPNDELRSHIDEQGARRGDNALMLEVLQRLSLEYARTGESRYAYKAAVILDRYAEVIGVWPFFDRSGDETYPHDVMLPQYGTEMPPHYGAFWSTWHPYDLQESHVLALAYDQIVSSGQMEVLAEETGHDVRLKIERDLLYANLEIADRYPLMYGNTDANLLLGLLFWGQALGDPELVHRAIRFGDGLRKIAYFPSSFWHEGSPSYHMMITGRWAIYYPMVCLDAYSDPPFYRDPVDRTRFNGADFRARYQPLLDRAALRMQKFVLPNGHYAAVHDTHWESNTTDRWDCYGVLDEYRPQESRPVLHTWVGHAILGRGFGNSQVQVHLHFSGTYGHDHKDNLNLFLWARGKELLSETDYYGNGNRTWSASTAAHNTVVIDEADQLTRSSAPQRRYTTLDSVPGVENAWFPRTSLKHGSALTDGQLRLFATDGPGLQVVEADGKRAYSSSRAKLYRRTVAMVETGGDDVYVADIFRVRGGLRHDWMLHGPLQEAHTVASSLNLSAWTGSRHTYLSQPRSATISDTWWVEFATTGGAAVRSTMLPSSSTDVTFFEGPGIRAAEQRTFVDVRRIGTESIFVAVHEPHGGTPRVRSAELVPIQSGSEMAVALRVTLVDRTDTILSTLDHTGTLTTTDVSFRGRFGFLSDAQSGNRSLYLADAELLYAGGSRLETSAAHTGSVLRTMIAEQGDAMDAFIIDSPVPDGDHAGKLFLTTDGDGSTRGFIIKSASGTTVEVDRNPGMSVENGYVKLQYFPNWGIPGDLSFRIISTALQTNP